MKNTIKATKKPVTIECVIWTGSIESTRNALLFMGEKVETKCNKASDAFCDYHNNCLNDGLTIKTLEGNIKASVGDFIIKGVNGEFYPCKPDIFHKTYNIE